MAFLVKISNFQKTYGRELIDTLKESPFLADADSGFKNFEHFGNLWFSTKNLKIFCKQSTFSEFYDTMCTYRPTERPDLVYSDTSK